jgi:hypothetical protein
LYGLRWSVETHLAELKTTLGMRKVKCKTPAGVEKELIVYALVYNLVRAAMLVAAKQQQVEASRISFIDSDALAADGVAGRSGAGAGGEPAPSLTATSRGW